MIIVHGPRCQKFPRTHAGAKEHGSEPPSEMSDTELLDSESAQGPCVPERLGYMAARSVFVATDRGPGGVEQTIPQTSSQCYVRAM